LGHDPRRCIRHPDVQDFASAHLIIQRPHNFLDRSQKIPSMEPVEINIVGLEPFQTGLQGVHQVLAMISPAIGIGGAPTERVLRRKHEALALALHELADELLAHAIGVCIRGIDEIAASFYKRVEDCAAFLRRGTDCAHIAEDHGSKAEFRDA
jgi:hypothetical protein